MRTTLNIDDQVLAEAKVLAHRSGTTLTAVVEDALRERLARRAPSKQSADTFRLPVFTGNGVQPGVDLDNSVALRDLMDDLV